MDNIFSLLTSSNLNQSISRITFVSYAQVEAKGDSICCSFSNFRNRIFGLLCFIISMLFTVVHLKGLNYRDERHDAQSIRKKIFRVSQATCFPKQCHGLIEEHSTVITGAFRLDCNHKKLVPWPPSAFCSRDKSSLVCWLTYPFVLCLDWPDDQKLNQIKVVPISLSKCWERVNITLSYFGNWSLWEVLRTLNCYSHGMKGTSFQFEMEYILMYFS